MRIGIGLIGAGIMGADHVRILARGVAGARLVGVQDADAARAETVAAECGAGRVFASASALIEAAEVDAVIIASPDATHAPLTLACLERRKPVLCEKPLAASLDECRAIIEREQALGTRLVQVGFMRRFDPGYRSMREAIVRETMGRPLMLHCAHRNAVAPDYITSEAVIANSMVHEFDIIRFLLGADVVQASVFSPRASRLAPGRSAQFAVLRLADGTLADIESFLDVQYGYDVRAELVCERGSLSLAPHPPVITRREGRDGFDVEPDWRGRFAEAYREQLRAWMVTIDSGVPSAGSSAWDGYAASVTAAACLAALRTGGRVDVALGERPGLYEAA